MKKNSIGLSEALELLNSIDDPMELMENKELANFIEEVEHVGQEILSPLDKDYLLGAISFLRTCSLAGLVSTGGNPILALALMESDDYAKLVTIIFKYCVGLSAIEELR